MKCDSCPHMRAIKSSLQPCQSCDCGSHHGASHVQATDFTLAQKKLDDHTPSSGVTNLDPDDEDKLRRAMSSLFGLDPIDLLMVQHIFHGRNLASFGECLETVHRKVHHYKPSSTRAMAHAKKNAIERVFPAIKPVFKHAIDPKATVDGDPDDVSQFL